jgi:hypothetical protein
MYCVARSTHELKLASVSIMSLGPSIGSHVLRIWGYRAGVRFMAGWICSTAACSKRLSAVCSEQMHSNMTHFAPSCEQNLNTRSRW